MPGSARRNRTWRRRLVLLSVVLLALAAVWFIGGDLFWTRDISGSPEALRAYILGFGAWAPVVFFLAQVAQVVLAPLPGGATAVVGILVFGPWTGTALSLAGGLAGSVALFALVRWWGRPLAVRLVGRRNFERYAGVFDDEKGALLLLVMLVPLVPDDVAVAAAGLSAVRFRRFAVVVVLGRLPGSAVTALVAAGLLQRSSGTLVLVGLAVVVAAALIFRKRLEAWLLRRARKDRP